MIALSGKKTTPLTKQSCCCLVAKSRLTLLRPPGPQPARSSLHGILQARLLEWVVISFSRGSSQSNPHLLHWQADSLQLNQQGSLTEQSCPLPKLNLIRILDLTTSSQEGHIKRYHEVPNSKIQTGKLYRTNHLISLTNKSHGQKKEGLRRHGRSTFKKRLIDCNMECFEP